MKKIQQEDLANDRKKRTQQNDPNGLGSEGTIYLLNLLNQLKNKYVSTGHLVSIGRWHRRLSYHRFSLIKRMYEESIE